MEDLPRPVSRNTITSVQAGDRSPAWVENMVLEAASAQSAWHSLRAPARDRLLDFGRHLARGLVAGASARAADLDSLVAEAVSLLTCDDERRVDFDVLSSFLSSILCLLRYRIAASAGGYPEAITAILSMSDTGERLLSALASRLMVEADSAIAAARGTAEMLQSIIDATPDWIFVKDRDHRYRMVNRSYAQGLHLNPEDFVGKDNIDVGFPESLVKGDPDTGVRGQWADDAKVLESGEPLLIPRDLVSVDGEIHIFDTIKIPLQDKDGQVWGLVGVARDMTKLKRAEEELKRYRDRLEELVARRTSELMKANERLEREIEERNRAEERVRENERYVIHTERLAAMGRMAAALAHEMNNPLQAVSTSLDLALDFPLDEEERREHVAAARREIERLMGVTQRTLDFARPPRLEVRPMSVPESLRSALDVASKQLQQHEIQVALSFPDDLPLVSGSADHITQVFLNLVLNAVDCMANGGNLTVAARKKRSMVEVAFSDTGHGLTPDMLSQIFEPFYSTKERGTGLGLFVCHNVIKQHRGTITASISPGGGAVFTVRLPVAN